MHAGIMHAGYHGNILVGKKQENCRSLSLLYITMVTCLHNACMQRCNSSLSQVYEKHDLKNVDAFIVTDRENDKNVAIDRVLCESILEADVADIWITDSGASGHIYWEKKCHVIRKIPLH